MPCANIINYNAVENKPSIVKIEAGILLAMCLTL